MAETYDTPETRLNLTRDIEAVENRLCTFVQLNYLRALWRDEFDITPYLIVHCTVIDLNGSEIGREDITNDTYGTTQLFADQTDRLFLLKRLDNLVPTLHKQPQFVIQLGDTLVLCYGTHNHTKALWLNGLYQLLQTRTLRLTANLLAHHYGIGERYKHHISPCDTNLGGQTRSLGIDRLFTNLYQNGVAYFQVIVDMPLFAHLRLPLNALNRWHMTTVGNSLGNKTLQRKKL